MSVVGTPSFHLAAHRVSLRGIAVVLALHVAGLWALVQLAPTVLPTALTVLTVDFITPVDTSRPEPRITPPTPRPVDRRPTPAQQPAQIAAPAESPASTPAIAAPPPAVPAPAAVTPTSATTQPRFDADYLDNPKPAYPPLSRRLGEQGRVVLRVHVDAGGAADDVQLQTSSGSPRLDQAALNTVRRWKFVPARRGSETVAAWVLVPIAFTLKE